MAEPEAPTEPPPDRTKAFRSSLARARSVAGPAPIAGSVGVEGLSRPAAATAGLVLALLMSGSALAIELPFAGTLAWTALMLGCAARCLRAGGWPGRLAWLAPAAGCWGQVAAAHLSDG